jgi:hypothetical protein
LGNLAWDGAIATVNLGGGGGGNQGPAVGLEIHLQGEPVAGHQATGGVDQHGVANLGPLGIERSLYPQGGLTKYLASH